MSITIALLGSLGLAKLVAFSSALAASQPAISWSPDSRWIAYTTLSRTRDRLPADWLFTRSGESLTKDGLNEPSENPLGPDQPAFQIWATRRDTKESALIEESKGILSAPSWRPDGRAIAFARFNPRERTGTQVRGTFEVVIREGLDHRKTLYTIDELAVDDSQLSFFSVSPPTWNRDGSGLAVCRPGESEAVLVIATRTGRLVRSIENANRPAWSPDGNRLAAIREGSPESSGDTLLIADSPLALASQPRPLMTQERILQPALWTGDSQSILAVYSRSRANIRSRVSARDIVLGRFSVATGDKNREWPLSTEPLGSRATAIRPLPGRDPAGSLPPSNPASPSKPPITSGRILDYDPDTEECFYVTDGLASSIVCYNLRSDITHRRFPPLDLSVGVGTLSVSPDGRTLAVRFKMSDVFSPPAFCDIATESLSIPTADPAIRSDWLSSLISMTQAQLRSALPLPTVLGEGIANRPVLLPAPGEVTPGHQLAARIQRLARIGRSLCEPASGSATGADPQAGARFQAQASLFFNYLVGDMKSAGEALDQLEASPLSPSERKTLLGVRAQILMSRGDLDGSMAIIDYLTRLEDKGIQTIEETPNGVTIHEMPNPRRLWGRFLSQRHADLVKTAAQIRISRPNGEDARPPRGHEVPGMDDRPRNPLVPLDPDARIFIEPPVFVRP